MIKPFKQTTKNVGKPQQPIHLIKTSQFEQTAASFFEKSKNLLKSFKQTASFFPCLLPVPTVFHRRKRPSLASEGLNGPGDIWSPGVLRDVSGENKPWGKMICQLKLGLLWSYYQHYCCSLERVVNERFYRCFSQWNNEFMCPKYHYFTRFMTCVVDCQRRGCSSVDQAMVEMGGWGACNG